MTGNINSKKLYMKKFSKPDDIIREMKKDNYKGNETEFIQFLRTTYYYRLSGYMKVINNFNIDKNFQNLTDLYVFDEDLRNVLFKYISKLELYIRKILVDDVLAKKYGPLGYRDSSKFRDYNHHCNLLTEVDNKVANSQDHIAAHFTSKYNYPPIWAVMELISFSTLRKFVSCLIDEDFRKVTAKLNSNNQRFESHIKNIVYIRNRCAHHNRVIGVSVTSIPKITDYMKNCGVVDTNSIITTIFILLDMMPSRIKKQAAEEFYELFENRGSHIYIALGGINEEDMKRIINMFRGS